MWPVMNLMLVNLLIAIMNDSYSEIKLNSQVTLFLSLSLSLVHSLSLSLSLSWLWTPTTLQSNSAPRSLFPLSFFLSLSLSLTLVILWTRATSKSNSTRGCVYMYGTHLNESWVRKDIMCTRCIWRIPSSLSIRARTHTTHMFVHTDTQDSHVSCQRWNIRSVKCVCYLMRCNIVWCIRVAIWCDASRIPDIWHVMFVCHSMRYTKLQHKIHITDNGIVCGYEAIVCGYVWMQDACQAFNTPHNVYHGLTQCACRMPSILF